LEYQDKSSKQSEQTSEEKDPTERQTSGEGA